MASQITGNSGVFSQFVQTPSKKTNRQTNMQILAGKSANAPLYWLSVGSTTNAPPGWRTPDSKAHGANIRVSK